MNRIFLIGYMGAGKTTIGKTLAKQTGLSFVDLDHFIEGRHHKQVGQIFEEKGEAYFREIERRALHEVADFENIIISTGGGTPCFFDNLGYMNTSGVTIYLKATVEELAERLEYSKSARPILKNLSGEELKQFIKNALHHRSFYYEQAQIQLETGKMFTDNEVEQLCGQLKNQLIMNI